MACLSPISYSQLWIQNKRAAIKHATTTKQIGYFSASVLSSFSLLPSSSSFSLTTSKFPQHSVSSHFISIPPTRSVPPRHQFYMTVSSTTENAPPERRLFCPFSVESILVHCLNATWMHLLQPLHSHQIHISLADRSATEATRRSFFMHNDDDVLRDKGREREREVAGVCVCMCLFDEPRRFRS